MGATHLQTAAAHTPFDTAMFYATVYTRREGCIGTLCCVQAQTLGIDCGTKRAWEFMLSTRMFTYIGLCLTKPGVRYHSFLLFRSKALTAAYARPQETQYVHSGLIHARHGLVSAISRQQQNCINTDDMQITPPRSKQRTASKLQLQEPFHMFSSECKWGTSLQALIGGSCCVGTVWQSSNPTRYVREHWRASTPLRTLANEHVLCRRCVDGTSVRVEKGRLMARLSND